MGSPLFFGPEGSFTRAYIHGFPSNSLVEVMHRTGDPCDTGYWMHFSHGSGVYYNLSRTIAFRTRTEACLKFGLQRYTDCGDFYGSKGFLRKESAIIIILKRM